jgi:hypothetical protein
VLSQHIARQLFKIGFIAKFRRDDYLPKVSLANYKMGGKTALLRYYGPGRGRLVR